MQIIVNGDRLEVEPGLLLVQLLERMGQSIEQVAVELNGSVMEPVELTERTLQSSDQLEIVHFVGGG